MTLSLVLWMAFSASAWTLGMLMIRQVSANRHWSLPIRVTAGLGISTAVLVLSMPVGLLILNRSA